ncbi:MAG TPA: winged helix-turn-helix domain-containing protein [Acidobacteriaceae bacterium]|nr:winged helix-turn-helix domain-containing protein [Acidobacteriaceae bacterium]
MSEKTRNRASVEGLSNSPAAAKQTESREKPRLYEFGPFRLDPAERILLRGHEIVPLTQKAFDTLHLLVRNSGHLLEKDELIRELWPDTFVEEGSLSNNIFLLRKALGEDPSFIETVPRRGYRFVGAVLQLPGPRHQEKPQLELASPVTQEPASSAVPQGQSLSAAPPTTVSSLPWQKLVVPLSVGALCIVVATLAYLKWRQPKPEQALATVPLTALPGWADFPAISPDGSRVVFEWTGEQDFTAFDLYVKTIGNEKLLRLTKDPATHLAPTWSPDGTQIAFQRVAKDRGGIYVVPAQGGTVRKLRSTNVSFDSSMHISWSPDGGTIAFADSPFPGGHKRLQLLSLKTLRSTAIEHNDKCIEEVMPAFSPDGKQLAYACSLTSREGEFGLSVVTADGRAPRIIKESSGWLKGLEWLPASKSLLFAEKHTGTEHEVLRELDVATGVVRDRMTGADSAFSAAFSASAGRLVYVVNTNTKNNIWRGDLLHADSPRVKLISTTRDQSCPRYSPDGKHIAFSSNRGGPAEIWMSDPDGQNVVQLTSLKSLVAGSPNWSPDSTRVSFDSRNKTPEGQMRADVYIVNVFERVPRKLTTGTPGAAMPSWSHDGKWIYFLGGSDDTSGERIYRVPSQGGKAEVLTTARGFWPLESADGQALYFAENSGTSFTLHVASLNPTGTESQVEDMPVLSFVANWDIVPGGVYFFPADDILTLNYFDFSTRKVRSIFKINGGGAWPGLSVSPEGRYVLYPELDDYRSDIMIVENFH